MMLKYRVHEVARDLNVKSKEVSDILKKYFGKTKKHMASLTEEELNFVFEYYTQKNSVEDFSEYFSRRRKSFPKPAPKKETTGIESKQEKKKEREIVAKSNLPINVKTKKFISKSDLKANLQK